MKHVFTIAGQGGQGVLSIGQTIAKYMNETGKHATFAPIYGPQQRGGPAKCTVVIEDEKVTSPMAKTCDVLIIMNQKSVKEYEKDLKPNGLFIYNASRVAKPTKRQDVQSFPIAADDMAKEAGNPRAVNAVMLGLLLHFLPNVDVEHFLNSFLKKFEAKGEEVMAVNRQAFQAGLEAGKEIAK